MKKQAKKIQEFIELRALGYTFASIVTKINVSKPTLIKWNRINAELVKKTEDQLAIVLVDKIIKRNY